MWPQVTDRWVLHIAATPHQVDDVLAELCIHKRAVPIGDPRFPACLAGPETPHEPPTWMSLARAELERRGYRTLWCDLDCPHHPSPANEGDGRGRADRRSPSGRTSLRRLIGRVPHHRGAVIRTRNDPAMS
ncbi:hypothetical protein [Actinoplanes sp. URMC 104]|uniref:hypothetical protein n=1 Tax=Actinoplanes sp. URMC 104 TaxID=3423409 RepID=UPI003F1BB1DB